MLWHPLSKRHQQSPTQEVDWSRANLEPILTLVKHAVEQGDFVPDPIIPLQIEPSRACFERARSEWM